MDVTLQLERESGELILRTISEALVTVKPLEEGFCRRHLFS